MDEYQYVLDSQLDIIKKGGTVKNAIAYNLDDTIVPVLLQAHKGVGREDRKYESQTKIIINT